MGWFYGPKLHWVVNDRGELLAFRITPGNVDDCEPVPELTQGLTGKRVGDRGYISRRLFQTLWDRGLHLITKIRTNMHNKLLPIVDKLLLRKRALINCAIRAAGVEQNFPSSNHNRSRALWSLNLPTLKGSACHDGILRALFVDARSADGLKDNPTRHVARLGLLGQQNAGVENGAYGQRMARILKYLGRGFSALHNGGRGARHG